ncbi:iron-containing alcohol dehydrogenase [Candidatus Pelagadaptatus aseana]|uniref:iron-containing alcohol dehydrogenase n=1 Tax=Candidatus Pelagadaptatus aseana TaxID=3120508 RepID=UPI003C6EE031
MLAKLEHTGNKLLMKTMGVATRVIPIREPQLYQGAESLLKLGQVIADSGHSKLLIVTGAGTVKRGQLDQLLRMLDLRSVEYAIYDGIEPDPTFAIVNDGLQMLLSERCDAVLAVGGGSAMDAAKVMALAAGNDCAPEKLKGYFKARKRSLPFYAAPTTAGTGSEVTIASVISEDRSHRKAFVLDTKQLPRAAALDPELMLSIPPLLTAATGMDALTHAIESYIGGWGTRQTDAWALEAVKLIYQNLPVACADGSDLQAREAMALASYRAGQAFTRASVGYVHAISHQLGARYGVPHGLGNAVILPHVVEFSRDAVPDKLARLAIAVGLGNSLDSHSVLAQQFVESLFELNQRLGLPPVINELKAEDINRIARAARTEAHLNYPVPKHMSQRECSLLLRRCLPR